MTTAPRTSPSQPAPRVDPALPAPIRPRAGLVAALVAVLATACAGPTPPDSAAAGAVVEPSLRAAAATAEATFDYRTAANHYATLHDRHPDDVAVTVRLARNLRYSGSPQAAIDLLEDTQAATGPAFELVFELAKANMAADRMTVALRYLNQALPLKPTAWEVHSALGVALDYQSKFAEAQMAYRTALSLSPDNPVVLTNQGLGLAQSGNLDQAVAVMQTAADQPRASAHVRQNLALVMALRGDADMAERLSRKDLPADMVRNNSAYFRLLANSARVQ